MKSPITGVEMRLIIESRELNFRKEKFTIKYHVYICEESGEQFTTSNLDTINLQQVYNLYRVEHNIPFPEHIKSIREQYGVTAKKMSEILGFGVNSYGQYERGEVPSLANARSIHLAQNPASFRELIRVSSLPIDKKENLILVTEKLIKKRANQEEKQRRYFLKYLLGNYEPGEYTGFRRPSIEKIANMVLFFSQIIQPWKTQLNKLLFYSDFLMFKQSCFSISGLQYRAIQRGPVPAKYQSLFEYFVTQELIEISYFGMNEDVVGEKFLPAKGVKFNEKYFSRMELQALHHVADFFKDKSTAEIVELSHRENAWIENHENKALISYSHAFALKI